MSFSFRFVFLFPVPSSILRFLFFSFLFFSFFGWCFVFRERTSGQRGGPDEGADEAEGADKKWEEAARAKIRAKGAAAAADGRGRIGHR